MDIVNPNPTLEDVQVFWTYEGLARARRLDFTSNGLDYFLKQPILKHRTISGWWFFDSPVSCDIREGETVKYRIHLETFAGVPYDTTLLRLVANKRGEARSEGTPTRPPFLVPPGPGG